MTLPIQRLANQMKLHGGMSQRAYSNSVIGFISSYDPDRHSCKITIHPADEYFPQPVVSGWIPVGSVWVGNGWGMFCPPSVGDRVEVDFQEGDFEAGHVDWRFFDDENRPVRAESGVFYLIHKSGSHLKFQNDGSVELTTAQDLKATVGRNLIATVTGTSSVTSTGNATVKAPLLTLDAPSVSCTGNLSVAGGISAAGTYGTTGGNITTAGKVIATGDVTSGGNVSDSVRTMAGDRTIFNGHIHPETGGSTGAPSLAWRM